MTPFSKHIRAPLTMAMILAAALPAAEAKVFTFGDSYSDNGNQNVVTGGVQPGSQYWAGRFTNGWTVAERLTFRLTNASPGHAPGLNSVQYPAGTSATGGIDFAHGGATAVTRSALPKHLSVFNQASYFRNEVAAKRLTANKQDTAIVWAGLNDYLAYNATTATSVSGTVAIQIVNLVAAAGVGKIMIFNLPNMGDLPGWIDGPRRASLNTLTAQHNTDLANRIALRQPSTAAKLILVDVNRALALAHQGLAGGFTVTRPGQGGSASGNCLGDGKVLWDCPSTYLYYDFVHLTAAGHEYLASVAQDRFNAVSSQTLQAKMATAGAGAAMAIQSQTLGGRFAALQTEDVDPGGARGMGGLGFFAYGESLEPQTQVLGFSQDRESGFGAGADLRWGEWFAGAAAFRVTPDYELSARAPEFGLTQKTDGASAYGGYATPDAALTLSATHARGEQETERLTAIQGLPRARGRTHFSASAIEMTGSAKQVWGAWSLTGEAAMRYDDTRVSGYQETGTLGLSDTVYDAVDAKGLTGRAGLSFGYEDQELSLSLGAHLVSRLSGDAPLEAALPVTVPGLNASRFDTGADAPLTLNERAAAATFAAGWRMDEGARLTVEAAAIATPEGEVAAGLSFGAKVEF